MSLENLQTINNLHIWIHDEIQICVNFCFDENVNIRHNFFTFTFTFAAFYIIKVTMGIRVDEEEEIRGLDISEHEMSAYTTKENSAMASFAVE